MPSHRSNILPPCPQRFGAAAALVEELQKPTFWGEIRGTSQLSLPRGAVCRLEGLQSQQTNKAQASRSKKASASRLAAHFSGLFASDGTAKYECYVLSYQKSGEMEGMAD